MSGARPLQVAVLQQRPFETMVSVVDAHTGKETLSQTLPYAVSQVRSLSYAYTPFPRSCCQNPHFALGEQGMGQYEKAVPAIIRPAAEQKTTDCSIGFSKHPLVPRQVVRVPAHVQEGKTEQALYLLVSVSSDGGNPSAHLLPDTEAAQQALATLSQRPHFWLHNSTTGAQPHPSGQRWWHALRHLENHVLTAALEPAKWYYHPCYCKCCMAMPCHVRVRP